MREHKPKKCPSTIRIDGTDYQCIGKPLHKRAHKSMAFGVEFQWTLKHPRSMTKEEFMDAVY